MKFTKIFLLVVLFLASCVPTTQPPTQTPTPTFTPAPTATQTPSPTPTIVPTPTQIGGGSGKLIFEYYKVAFEKSFPSLKGEVNIFTSNLDGTELIPVTNGLNGYNYIQSISPDGQMVLVASSSTISSKSDLYLVNLNLPDSSPIKLARGLDRFNITQAIFLDNNRIVYIGQGPENYGFYIVNIDGTNLKKISTPDVKPFGIVSANKTQVYWGSFVNMTFKDSSGFRYAWGRFDALQWTNIDGSGQGKLISNGSQVITDDWYRYAFSADGNSVAWIPAQREPGCSYTQFPLIDVYARKCFLLHVASLSSMENPTTIPLIPSSEPTNDNVIYNLRWWPDGSKILAYGVGEGHDYYSAAVYKVTPKDTIPQLAQLKVLSTNSDEGFTLPSFSPDGRQILFAKYDIKRVQNGYSYDAGKSIINIVNLETMNYVNGFDSNVTPDSQVQRVGNIYWLP